MSGLRTISKLRWDRTKVGLGLPPPWAAIAGSPHDPEGSSRNLGHMAESGPQDYLGVSWPKL